MTSKLIAVLAAVAAIAFVPMSACAVDLDAPLHCDRSAHDFVSKLLDDKLIEPQPMHVEDNSINAFNPASGASLSAFGFHVFAIVGFEKDDPIFRPGDGKMLSRSAYGAVVLGSTEKVRAAVEGAHSPAIVHHVGPFITAIFCDRD
ncbi:hypothetical protein [Trinickia fusca]|uniref:Uncharacterized protein n=1 Tax=Trinickia fusca TaxID=2419777 RepID=A0A494X391_9BURK|nr:hypothetical protein [Trinickia fusca]RKP45167.1 hypothetical protein D7S89_20245 [Trinickia fusca]